MITQLLEQAGRWLSPVTRSTDEQQRVDEAATQLSLYHYPSCPFCFRVMHRIKRLNIRPKLCNIHADRDHYQALVTGGGKPQVPCLLIRGGENGDRWLYESKDIARYLQQRFGEETHADGDAGQR